MPDIWHIKSGLAMVRTQEALRQVLLQQRGLALDDSDSFFAPSYERDIHDPLSLHDMKKAVDRIYRAIERSESIVVHGDYDADGITSTAIMVSVLKDLGAQVTPFLPHRADDGYGLNINNLKKLAPEMDLLLTVDCGISNTDEVAFLKQQGIDVIIIDHHIFPADAPPALAIVHPNHPQGSYAWPHLCGAGTAWKVASALLRDRRSPFHNDGDAEKWLLDLTALGTIADMMPLLDENRAIVTFGLEILKRTKRPGLQALLTSSGILPHNLTAEDVAFQIIPKLNAAGRLDHPQPALEILITSDADRAQELLGELNRLNTRRQTLTRQIVKEAEAYVNNDPFIFAANMSWPAGIVGLAAGRLADRFGKPAVVIGGHGVNAGQAVGSARSPVNVNILEMLQQGKAVLDKLGGHAQAAGFSLAEKNLSAFREMLGANQVRGVQVKSEVDQRADVLVDQCLLTVDTVSMLEKFAPFGQANTRPKFLLQAMQLVNVRSVGKQQEHAKFIFDIAGESFDGIGFGLMNQIKANDLTSQVDVIGELVEDEWQGRRRLQLMVKAVASAGVVNLTTT